MGGEVVGGGAGRRGDQGAIAGEFGQPLLAVDRDGEAGGLPARPQQRYLVDRHDLESLAPRVGGDHAQRRQAHLAGTLEPLQQAGFPESVQQEADGAEVHAVDRCLASHVAVQRLQHQSVAAQGHDDVGFGRLHRAVALLQARARGPCRRRGGRDECELRRVGVGHRDAAMPSMQESHYSRMVPPCDKIPTK